MTSNFTPGSQVGDYVLDAYIGGGSFGAVWRAHRDGDSQPVALKLLTGDLQWGDNAGMRADIELLAAAAAAESEHVVKVLDGGLSPVPYIVMEYIEGSDLEKLLAAQGRLSPRQTIDVGLAISDALRALNDAGIIHRDVKPANVMIDKAGVIKLADFGIAKIVGYKTVTMAGQAAMTMAYAAPEIWEEDGPFGRASHRSDLYAMGVLLYQCLTGAPPFNGSYGSLFRAHTERAPDLATLPTGTPASLRTLIRRCLEKRQDDRPADASACIAMLKRSEVELAESAGEASREPRRFGPWIKDRPHESVPWAWRCHHETSGAQATVDLHFAGRAEDASRFTRAVEASAGLSPLGAERLLETNRLLLHPNEAWQGPPAGRFQFWVAREDLPQEEATSISEDALRAAAAALVRLIEAATALDVALELRRDNVSVAQDGAVYVRRPGLVEVDPQPQVTAMSLLRSLPLTDSARSLLDSAASLRALAGLADATVVAGAATQIVAAPNEPTRLMTTARQEPAAAASAVGTSTPATNSRAGRGHRTMLPWLAAAGGAGIAIVLGAVLLLGGGKSDKTQQGAIAPETPATATAVSTATALPVQVAAPSPTVASPLAPIVGRWMGTATDMFGDTEANTHYPVIMTVAPSSGQIEYPSFACSGNLVFSQVSAGTYAFTERIQVGDCVDNGRIQVALKGSQLDWLWFYADGTLGVTATLDRQNDKGR